MSDIIQLLPDHIANQIAAGEVVQRPASVVKELLENSIDAGAKTVRLIIKDAGKTLIQVVDDGIGMSETDARMCFERHATSKIRKAEDLFLIRTMGFRGEAMASIAAVAHVEMRTKKHHEELGTRIVIEGSRVSTQEPCQTAAGTSIAVKNLFFNIPARRNFLKSNAVEMRHIIDEFQRVALTHPSIFFTLHHNNEKLFHLPKTNLRQRIVGILGSKTNEKLIPISEETDIIKITGFIGKPEFAKKTRGEQFFFVNDRFIRSNYLHHAVMNAYEELLAAKQYPLYAIFFDLDPAKIDVNVHPTKQEIKFEDERLVYNYLRVTVKHALAQNSITPTLDFDVETSISQHFDSKKDQKTEESSSLDSDFGRIESRIGQDNRPKEQKQSNSSSYSGGGYSGGGYKSKKSELEVSNLNNWEKLYEGLQKSPPSSELEFVENEEEELNETFTSKLSKRDSISSDPQIIKNEEEARKPYQLHNQYIISPIKSGFMLIDQHIAHIRIRYEQYLQFFGELQASTQKLLFPQTLELSTNDSQLVKEILPELNVLGLDIKEFGNQTFVIHGLPPQLGSADPQTLLEQIVEQYKNNLEIKLTLQDNLARTFAFHSAVKRGKSLTQIEMKQLIDELFACEVPYRAPNGQRTFITLKFDELAKKFAQ
ncbi:MAG: DNA mismatch repair endonuclease MutL [Saprospiraceae bacterium]|nr:DNA mismatch repair endonuclease MutL [Saprospiraceae bacterium]